MCRGWALQCLSCLRPVLKGCALCVWGTMDSAVARRQMLTLSWLWLTHLCKADDLFRAYSTFRETHRGKTPSSGRDPTASATSHCRPVLRDRFKQQALSMTSSKALTAWKLPSAWHRRRPPLVLPLRVALQSCCQSPSECPEAFNVVPPAAQRLRPAAS